MDKNSPENSGFRAYFRYPNDDGEEYSILIKAEKSWQNAVSYCYIEAKRRGVEFYKIEKWNRYKDHQKEVLDKYIILIKALLKIQGNNFYDLEERIEDELDFYWKMMDEETIELAKEACAKTKGLKYDQT